MKTKLSIGMGLALVLGACASTPQPNAALETARTAVQSAEADPNVSKYAALDLESAKKDLEIAEGAAMHHKDAEIAQPAYLATQTARLAQVRASAKADDARVAAGQVERDRIQLSARTREVQNAKMATTAATEEAARLQAEAFWSEIDLPQVPTLDEVRRYARARLAQTPSLDDIAVSARRRLLDLVHSRLVEAAQTPSAG